MNKPAPSLLSQLISRWGIGSSYRSMTRLLTKQNSRQASAKGQTNKRKRVSAVMSSSDHFIHLFLHSTKIYWWLFCIRAGKKENWGKTDEGSFPTGFSVSRWRQACGLVIMEWCCEHRPQWKEPWGLESMASWPGHGGWGGCYDRCGTGMFCVSLFLGTHYFSQQPWDVDTVAFTCQWANRLREGESLAQVTHTKVGLAPNLALPALPTWPLTIFRTF